MDKITRKTVMPGVTLLCLQTAKFKTGYFSVALKRQLCPENAAKDSIIPQILKRGCRRYPDMESLSAALDDLYGAVVEPIVRQRGEVLCTGFCSSFVDDKYLPGEAKTLEKTISLVAELLLDPATKDGLLNAEYVNSEKENLCDDIRSRVNDKRVYAAGRLREIMCAEENYGTYAYGTLETAEKIQYIPLTKYYKESLAESDIYMFYCGSASPMRVEMAIKEAFATLPRTEDYYDTGTEIRINAGEPKYVTEEMDVAQGNLTIGFRMGEVMYRPNYAAMTLFNTIYGGGVTSKLFANVREKLSLCYYASSSVDNNKGIMTVSSGIDPTKYEDALAEILAQLDACRKGDISDKEFEAAKSYVVASLRSYNDSASTMDDFYLGQELKGLTYDLDEYAGLVDMVELADIVEIAKSVELDTVYFLKNRGEAV